MLNNSKKVHVIQSLFKGCSRPWYYNHVSIPKTSHIIDCFSGSFCYVYRRLVVFDLHFLKASNQIKKFQKSFDNGLDTFFPASPWPGARTHLPSWNCPFKVENWEEGCEGSKMAARTFYCLSTFTVIKCCWEILSLHLIVTYKGTTFT
jgi:hypothetical protein